jgi:hypothetical protein
MTSKIHGSMLMGIVLSVLAVPVQATLISYTSGGENLVYDDDRYLTWLADANLFKTQSDADPGTAQAIIDDIGTIDDTAGTHTLVLGDFDTSNGRMTWWGAMAWAEWLGNEGYGGTNDWELWSGLNSDGTGPLGGPNVTDSDLGHLNYIEGGLVAGQPITDSAILNNHFSNLQASAYWAIEENGADFAIDFGTTDGDQFGAFKTSGFFGWAVRPGQVPAAAAPLPATGLLMALGLIGIGVGRSRRRLASVLR